MEVSSIRFTSSGSGDDAGGLLQVRLFDDLNADGDLDGADVLLAAAAGYPADNQPLTFSGLSETIPAATTVHWLLVYDFAPTVSPNDKFCARVASRDDILLNGVGQEAIELRDELANCISIIWSSTGDDEQGANYGFSVASAGDVNGDGYADVIVGAYGYDLTIRLRGKAYVYLGGSDGVSTTPAWTSTGEDQYQAYYGASVASAGDVNNDGYADIIVGAYRYSTTNSPGAGKVYVYHGGPAGPSATPDWTSVGDDQFTAWFGRSVASAGDVNGDGYSDVIVGAYLFESPTASDVGKAYVYLGASGGLQQMPVWTSSGDEQQSAWFGFTVASAGDVNGDGFSDVIVGAPGCGFAFCAMPGKAFLYHGGPGGLTQAAAATFQGDVQWNDAFGAAVASAGDVNGDGFSDVIVGAPGFETANLGAGKAYLYLGGPGGLSTAYSWASSGEDLEYAVFGLSVASAGDLNGDGLSDVIVSAPHRLGAPPGAPPGRVFVYFGEPGGLSPGYAWSTVGEGQSNANFGRSVASAGDVDNDGSPEVIVGAYRFRIGPLSNEQVGKVYILSPCIP